jgi:hypothetical protein
LAGGAAAALAGGTAAALAGAVGVAFAGVVFAAVVIVVADCVWPLGVELKDSVGLADWTVLD